MAETYPQTDSTNHERIVHCTQCEFSAEARSQVHAAALGKRHYHNKGHAVCIEVV